MFKARLNDIGSWVLVLCAVATTVLVVRREFLPGAVTTSDVTQDAIYVDGWQDALAVGIRSGPSDAPVQVVEFADFQCPWCARFETTARTVRQSYPDQVAFTLVYFPLPRHSFAEPAIRAAECASSQGRFEEMRALLFEKQQAFGLVAWTEFAKEASIPDVGQFDACMNDTRSVERATQGLTLAHRMGVRGTPTIFVNGWKLPGTPSSEHFDEIVKNVLDGRPPASNVMFFAAKR